MWYRCDIFWLETNKSTKKGFTYREYRGRDECDVGSQDLIYLCVGQRGDLGLAQTT